MDATAPNAPVATYVADRALLPEGWTSDARFEVRPDGRLGQVGSSVATGTTAEGGASIRIPGIVIPGVPNAHSHAFQRGLAGRAEKGGRAGDDFWGWRNVMYRFLDQLSPDDVEAIASWLYVEMVESGFTSVAEFHYLHRAPGGAAYDDPAEMSLRLARSANAAGIRMTLLPTVYLRGGFDGGPLEGGQRRFRMTPDEVMSTIRAVEGTAGGASIHAGVGLHSLRAVGLPELWETLASLVQFGDAAEGMRRPVHIHVAEQTGEVRAAQRWVGARPVEFLLSNAPVDDGWCLVHATHMTDFELSSVASARATVCLCPTTEANLGDGLFRAKDYIGQGGSFAIGSDSQISVSPTAELRLLEYGQRLRLRSRNVVSSQVKGTGSSGRLLLERAWAGGARALGHERHGLRTGAPADLIVLDPDHPSLVGHGGDDVLDAWVFSGEANPVDRVMVRGRWVVEGGRHNGREAILARFRSTMRHLA